MKNGNYEFTSEPHIDTHSEILRNYRDKPFIAKDFSTPKPREGMSTKISPDKKYSYIHFIRSHFNTHSQRSIARMLHIGKTTVNTLSKEAGLKSKKDTVNEEFFDNLNEQSAYILGFIFADGNVAWDEKKGYYTLSITASQKDVAHLEKIRKIMSSTKQLYYALKTKSYKLVVNNKKICMSLMNFGVIPRKSLVVKFPDIPKEYLRHFIRGVIDGDGGVRYFARKRSPYFEIMVCSGSREFCEKLVETIREETGIDTNIRKKSDHLYIMTYSCSRGKKLAQYIYSDATIFLERKYRAYKENVLEEKNE